MTVLQLKKNKQLDRFFVRDFNQDPNNWAEKSNTFDAVLCCASVQYMQQPECVFAEILRVLKPDGVCIVTFSNRLFYEKAIRAWRNNSAFGRISLVKQYFACIQGKQSQALGCCCGTAMDSQVVQLMCWLWVSFEIVCFVQGSQKLRLCEKWPFPQENLTVVLELCKQP